MARQVHPRSAARMLVSGACAVVVAVVVPAAPAAAAQDGEWWRGAWRMAEVRAVSGGAGVTVALLDTGVDASVPELAGAVVPGTDLVGRGTDGRVELADGHGTRMASLIAADGIGVAPGVTILPVVASVDAAGGEVATDLAHTWVAEGIRYATDNGAEVVNISLATDSLLSGEFPCPPQLLEAIRYAVDRQVVIVAGAGNTAGGPAAAPGSCPGVLTVGAVDERLVPWEGSHRDHYVDVAAPGVDLRAVSTGGEPLLSTGTSAATALVSGVAALVRQEFPEASAREVTTRIIGTATDVEAAGWDEATGFGVVDPLAALTGQVSPDTPNPSYDALERLPTGDGAGPTPPAAGPPRLPPPQIPPAAGEQSPAGTALTGLVLAGLAVLLIGLSTLVVVLLVRRRHAWRPGYPAGYPAPGYGSAPPATAPGQPPGAPPGRPPPGYH